MPSLCIMVGLCLEGEILKRVGISGFLLLLMYILALSILMKLLSGDGVFSPSLCLLII